MKIIIQLLFILVAFCVLATLGAGLYLDSLAKKAVQTGGTYALGVETTLDSADVGLFKGELAMGDLVIANPEGFNSESFLSLESGSMKVDLSSLAEDTVRVKRLEFDGVQLRVDQNADGTNYDVLLANLAGLGSEGGEPTQAQEASATKNLAIDEIIINNVVATVQLLALGGDATRVEVKVPRVVLKDLSSDMTVAETFSTIIRELLNSVVAAGDGVLPADFRKNLDRELSKLGFAETEAKIDDALDEGAEKAGKELQRGLNKLLDK